MSQLLRKKCVNQIVFILVCASFIAGCSEQNDQQQMLKQAVAIEAADECHLCGMLIVNFPGPKGEIAQKNSERIEKFCSTRDLFSYVLQPENRRQITQIFVHDMSKSPWGSPNDEHFVDAKTAWYVIGSDKKGAMGETLASFSQKSDAEAFSVEFGGKVIGFDEITLETL
ncbi:nitrous oxide reductase accessory protein NosL [Aliivibrio kagoshimensis]|uniref:nitrous oxide reductase accessory protein NosL n=1 Tax=Aliivibrio kagoshimensis TaxID=2910230 RepID=UPI003D0BF052